MSKQAGRSRKRVGEPAKRRQVQVRVTFLRLQRPGQRATSAAAA